jgi:hypothetical protein
MAWTRTDIANRALGILGVSDSITDVDTGTTREAKAIRAVLDIAIESMASEFRWPLTVRVEEMSLVDGTASEAHSDDWQYAYRYSSYWVKFFGVREDETNGRQETEKSKIPYLVISDTSGRLILTDLEDASAEVAVLPEEGFYPAKYVEALANKVAMMAAPRLEGSTRKPVDLRAQYEAALSDAKATAANESGYEMPLDTPAVAARRGLFSRRWGWRVGDPLE